MGSSVVFYAAAAGTLGALLMALANWPGYLKERDRKTYGVLMMIGIFFIFGSFMMQAGDWLHRTYGSQGLLQLLILLLANLVVWVTATKFVKKRKAH